MVPGFVGGLYGWRGLEFELRLGVEFCTDILMGELAGFPAGPVRSVQLQAPDPVDNLVLDFESGTRWAIQAKAGYSVQVEWGWDRPFGKALRQLHSGLDQDQIDTSTESLDRVVLAVDHRADPSIARFADWLDKARHHLSWEDFARASFGEEQKWLDKLPALLEIPPDDDLLGFLQKLHVKRTSDRDSWWSDLCGRLVDRGVPDKEVANWILDELMSEVATYAPQAGKLDAHSVHRACEGIPGLPRPGSPPFRVFHQPSEDDLYRALRTSDIQIRKLVKRPELTSMLTSQKGVFVSGRPGAGMSHALIKLALAQPQQPVVVISRSFRADDLGRLAASLRRIHGPYQLLWDDAHEKPELFGDTVIRAIGRGDQVRVLAAYHQPNRRAVERAVPPNLYHQADIDSLPIALRPFDQRQATRMVQTVVDALQLPLDDITEGAYADHVMRGDGGPLFALSIGHLLHAEVDSGRQIGPPDVDCLPDELFVTWQHLYTGLAHHPDGSSMRNLLGVLRFLHQIGCPLQARLAELLYGKVLGRSTGEFIETARALENEGWLQLKGDQFTAHDLTLAAVPSDDFAFQLYTEFARQSGGGKQLPLGMIQEGLSRFYAKEAGSPSGTEETLAKEAVEWGKRAVATFQAARHEPYLAGALCNLAERYAILAELAMKHEARKDFLHRALDASEEAAELYRGLGQASELAAAQNNASTYLFRLSRLMETPEWQADFLGLALAGAEEAVELHRRLSLKAEEAISQQNVWTYSMELGKLVQTPERRAIHHDRAEEARKKATGLRKRLGLRTERTPSYLCLAVAPPELPPPPPLRPESQQPAETRALLYLANVLLATALLALALILLNLLFDPSLIPLRATPTPATEPVRARVEVDIPTCSSGPCLTGSQQTVRIRSSHDGFVSVDTIDSQGERAPLFGMEVRAGQTVSRSWQTPNTGGEWNLVVALNKDQAFDVLTVRLIADVTPPLLDEIQFEPEEAEGRYIPTRGDPACPGDRIQVCVLVSDDNEISTVELRSRFPAGSGSWSSVAMETSDGQLYCSALVAQEPPGLEYCIYAEDVYGNNTGCEEKSYAVEPCFDVLYDFVEKAPTATWLSYTPSLHTATYTETNMHGPAHHLGGAHLQENIILEDGDSYPQVLEVHPPWVPGGELWGEYDLRHLPLQRGDFFFAKVGFPQSAVRGEATFKIHYRTDQADAPVTTVASLADQYDGEDQEKQIKSWQVPLADDLTGGYFYLEVDAGSKTLQDEATWVEAQILRPLR